VLYGSETGTAQDVAEELGRIAERLRFDAEVAELNAITLVCMPHWTWSRGILTVAAEATAPVFSNTNRHFHHRSRRPARKQPDLLESAAQRSTAPWVLATGALCVVWTWRYLISQVSNINQPILRVIA